MPSDEQDKAAGNLTPLDLMKAMADVENRAMHKVFGTRRTNVSQPIDREKKLKLTQKAQMVNRMLHMDMSETQIANVLGTTRQSVSQIDHGMHYPERQSYDYIFHGSAAYLHVAR